MKTNHIALAVASLCASAAFAQDNNLKVNLYGILDVAYASGSNQATGISKSRIISGGDAPSIFGATGSKDMANGMKLAVTYEGNVSTATGASGLFTRSANFSLTGSMGTVRAGRQYDPAFLAYGETDPRGLSMNNSGLNAWINGSASTGVNSTSTANIFTSNTVSWTNKFGGFTPTLAYGTGNSDSRGNSGGNVTSLGLVYNVDQIKLSGGMVNNKADGTNTTDSKGQSLGGAYTAGPVRVALNYLNFKTTSGSTPTNLKTTGLGGSYDIGSGLSANLALYTTKNGAAGGGKLTNTTAGVSYVLDKQVTMYAQMGTFKASTTGFTTTNYTTDANNTYATVAGKTVQTLYLGTKVTF